MFSNNKTLFFFAAFKSLVVTTVLPAENTKVQQNWSQWRGPLATGYAPHANPPIEWSETKTSSGKPPCPALAILLPSCGVIMFTSLPPFQRAKNFRCQSNPPVPTTTWTLFTSSSSTFWPFTVEPERSHGKKQSTPPTHNGGHRVGHLASGSTQAGLLLK